MEGINTVGEEEWRRVGWEGGGGGRKGVGRRRKEVVGRRIRRERKADIDVGIVKYVDYIDSSI